MFMKIVKAALLGLSLSGSASLAQADALENITAAGTLRVAVPEDFAPFGMKGTDLKPIGYDIDVATHVAEKLGVTLKLVPVSGANPDPRAADRQGGSNHLGLGQECRTRGGD